MLKTGNFKLIFKISAGGEHIAMFSARARKFRGAAQAPRPFPSYAGAETMCILHRVLVAILNPKISRLRKILVFRSVWLVRITSNIHFYPIPKPHIMIFTE